jgi:hypothetical protein
LPDRIDSPHLGMATETTSGELIAATPSRT